MKVGTYAPVIQIAARGTEKTGDKNGGGSAGFQRQQKEDSHNPEFKATLEEVDAAIEKFVGDEAALTHGITAESSGNGPGLKVLLKDSTGGVLRSVSGEEFLKLREAVNAGRRSGRILDQKA